MAIIVTAAVLLAVLLIATQKRVGREEFSVAFDAEFLSRPDGYPGLKEAYGLEFKRPPMQMDPGLMYRALAEGTVNLIDGFATDGRIKAYKLFVLEDDREFFPPYYAAPLVRRETLEKHPELEDILNSLAGKISDSIMQQLNYQVDEKGKKAGEVAEEFLLSENLIGEAPEAGTKSGSIRIGGKHFTEQEILGEIMSILIERNTNIGVERRLNLGGTIICFNALRTGDIDIYAEYTGTGLVNILKHGVITEPESAYRKVREEFEKEYGLIWLEPFGFNNTYTLTMREREARKMGIRSISGLAEFLNAR